MIKGALRPLTDTSAVLLSFAVAHWTYGALGATGGPGFATHMSLAFWFLPVVLLVFWHLGLYTPKTSVLNLWELVALARGVLISSTVFLSAAFILAVPIARAELILSLLTTIVVAVSARRILGALVRHRRLKKGFGLRVVILGSGEVGRLILKKIVEAPHLPRRVVGFLDDEAPIGSFVSCTLDQTTGATLSRAVLGRPEDLPEVARRYGLEELLIDESAVGAVRLGRLIELARELRIRVGVVPSLEGFRADQLGMEDLSAIPVLRPGASERPLSRRVAKRCLDVVGGSVLLIATSPFWILAAALIRLESGSPVWFRQTRIGEGGREFEILKFRTMRQDTERYAPSPRGDADPRMTKVGRVLRLVGFDELPQLINVLRGDMSLVGPRPEMPFVVDEYTPFQRRRLNAKPGITGLWQLSPDRHAQIHENLEYDLYYINHESLTLDLAILVETALRTFEIVLRTLWQRIRAFRDGAKRLRSNGTQRWRVHRPPSVWPAVDGARSTRAKRRAGYVLLALDQRRENRDQELWTRWVGVATTVSQYGEVRILAAEPNRKTLDGLLATSGVHIERSGIDIQFVRAVHGGDVDVLVGDAQLVITDLPRLRTVARRHGRNVLWLKEGRARFSGNPEALQDLLDHMGSGAPGGGPPVLGEISLDQGSAGVPH